MRTDRELLELAAKAAVRAGLKLECPDGVYVDRVERRVWNPLTDDGDAFRLAVQLRLIMEPNLRQCNDIDYDHFGHSTTEDRTTAMREAIVQCAAEIGAAM